MRVFVTGATGWVGSALVRDLLEHGHSVTGLTRSEAGEASLRGAGATPVRGTLADLEILTREAAAADAVAHTGFEHDWSRFAEVCAQDERAIQALGEGLRGTHKPLLVSSGVALLAHGRPAVEQDRRPAEPGAFPRVSEQAAEALRGQGIRAASVRLAPTTHGIGDHGFVPILISIARERKQAGYVGDGENRWPAVHRLDAARVYHLALEQGATEAAYHAVAEEGVAFRDIAAAIGQGLGVPVVSVPPEKAAEHFGWFAMFAAADMPASSAHTRAVLGWSPNGPRLLADLAQQEYFEAG